MDNSFLNGALQTRPHKGEKAPYVQFKFIYRPKSEFPDHNQHTTEFKCIYADALRALGVILPDPYDSRPGVAEGPSEQARARKKRRKEAGINRVDEAQEEASLLVRLPA